MLARSLRAVLRKESCIFCAGLLLSIADLLCVVYCRLPSRRLTGAHERARTTANVPRKLFPVALEQSGLPAGPYSNSARSELFQQMVRSTIRRSAPLFNREVIQRLQVDSTRR